MSAVASRGFAAPHDTDRAMRELLEETRIAQMGGQISLGFLLTVAYTPVVRDLGEADRLLYGWAVVVTTAAVVLLLAPVPLHRLNFGRRVRREVLLVGHVVTLVGLVCLGVAIVLSVTLAARIAAPASSGWIAGAALALVVLCWLVLPLSMRRATAGSDEPQPSWAIDDDARDPAL